MRLFQLLSSTVVTGLMSLVLTGQTFAAAQLSIATEGYLRPYNFTRPDGTLDGYEIELGKYLCQHMKVECTFVAQPFDGLITGLNAGKFDVIMAGLTATAAREQIIDFSTSYSLTPQVFATLKGGRYQNLPQTNQTLFLSQDPSIAKNTVKEVRAALAGAIVGVTKGTVDDALVQAYFRDAFTVREYRSGEEGLLDLMSGRIDAVVNSRAFLSATAKIPGYEKLALTGPFYLGSVLGRGVGVGIRKSDTQLLKDFNEAIDSAKADGTIKRLSMKWFGFDVTP
ncbi:transporter substrate-binding domain-containing protein [Brucella pseudogrignonensis]|uniref:Octopine/nopaline transport system substrate-binding protein n=1 Tax=Brucella pseudogrignonensis TaxID=419475 RepID=A0ABU1MAG2_9HYPH|nr:transporter substrate-binding domain-containing protein [Brucella pseudogrignonensis]MDR6433027.1 octopine/nopaline transport system substrate-binding protein [Brucella pseudogrignonensis]